MIRPLLFARCDSKKTALLAGERTVTYHALHRQAAALYEPLQPLPQEPVAVLLPNDGAFIAALWGVLSAGRTAFPLNPQLTVHELLPLLRQSGAAAVITCAAWTLPSQGIWKKCVWSPQKKAAFAFCWRHPFPRSTGS